MAELALEHNVMGGNEVDHNVSIIDDLSEGLIGADETLKKHPKCDNGERKKM